MGNGIIYLHEWLIFMVNVVTYTSPMDPMGSPWTFTIPKGKWFFNYHVSGTSIKLWVVYTWYGDMDDKWNVRTVWNSTLSLIPIVIKPPSMINKSPWWILSLYNWVGWSPIECTSPRPIVGSCPNRYWLQYIFAPPLPNGVLVRGERVRSHNAYIPKAIWVFP